MRRILEPFSNAAYWLIWPALYFIISGSHRTRVLVILGDKVLVMKNFLGDGRWSLPGGGIHKHEGSTVGAARELAEETAIKLKPGQLKFLGARPCTNRGITYTAHYFVAHLDNTPTTKPNLEVIQLYWAKPAELTTETASPDVLAAMKMLDKQNQLL
jgi:ADP-ribose pyrophosphatase YjhB (NUDIX family)